LSWNLWPQSLRRATRRVVVLRRWEMTLTHFVVWTWPLESSDRECDGLNSRFHCPCKDEALVPALHLGRAWAFGQPRQDQYGEYWTYTTKCARTLLVSFVQPPPDPVWVLYCVWDTLNDLPAKPALTHFMLLIVDVVTIYQPCSNLIVRVCDYFLSKIRETHHTVER